LTPHYASPEQVAGEAITVQSDVYSLGVLLYELLTRTLPIAPLRGTLGAVEEAILEGDAPPASSRVKDRGAASVLRGEIDAILAMAMQRKPARRYSTADAMTLDIDRYLQGETVSARPDSLAYRTRKALRRHWVGVSAVATVLAAVFSGAGVAAVQAHRANAEADRARLVKEFVVDIFKINGRDNPAALEVRQLPADLLLERGSRLIESKFARQPLLQAELYGVVSGIFADLGASRLSADYATRQSEALTATRAEPREQAQAMLLLSRALLDLGRLADAEARARAGVALSEGDSGLQTRARLNLAKVLTARIALDEVAVQLDLVDESLRARSETDVSAMIESDFLRGNWLTIRNRFDDARPLFERAINLAARTGRSTKGAETQMEYARLLGQLGYSKEASQKFRDALDTLRSLAGPDDVLAATLEAAGAYNLTKGGALTFEEARDMALHGRSVLAMRPGLPRMTLARADLSLGAIYAHYGRFEQADAALSRISAQDRLAIREVTGTMLQLTHQLGFVAVYMGRHEEADAQLRESLALASEIRGVDSGSKIRTVQIQAMNLWMQRRFDEAQALLAATTKVDRLRGTADNKFRDMLVDSLQVTRARLELERGDAAAALRLLPPVDKLGTTAGEEQPMVHGAALCALNRPSEGLPYLMSFEAGNSATGWAIDPDLARARALTGLCALKAGDRARAAAYAKLANEALAQQPGLSPYFRQPAEQLNALLRKNRAPR
jgi:tetratricopeptide (TPR) repeat protein